RFVPRRGAPGHLPRTERRGQLRPPLRPSEPCRHPLPTRAPKPGRPRLRPSRPPPTPSPTRTPQPGYALWHIPVDPEHRTSDVLCVDRDPPSLGRLQTAGEGGAWTLRDSAA